MATHPDTYDDIVVGAGSAGCAVAAGLFAHEGGRRVGGSGSINSMVWFRDCASDFDDWIIHGWAWADVAPAFDEIEAQIIPIRMNAPYPLTENLHTLFGGNATTPPTPKYASAGACHLHITNNHASGVVLGDSTLKATKGVILSAESIGSPDILMRRRILMSGAQSDIAYEVHPSPNVTSFDQMRTNAGTAHQPVGTLRMGKDDAASVTPNCQVRLWATDASLMPAVTFANTNAPSMMNGHRAASFIAA